MDSRPPEVVQSDSCMVIVEEGHQLAVCLGFRYQLTCLVIRIHTEQIYGGAWGFWQTVLLTVGRLEADLSCIPVKVCIVRL